MPAIPQTADELEDLISDGERLGEFFDNGTPRPEFAELIKAYLDKTRRIDPGLDAQIHDEVERVNAQWLRDNSTKIKRPDLGGAPTRMSRGVGHNPKAPGAGLDDMFTGSGDYFNTIFHKQRRPEALDKQGKILNDYGSSVPADGGFLIPEVLRAQLLSVALETAVVRPRAMVVPMDSLRVPFPTIDSTSNATSVHGGLVGYWTEESAALTESQATFGRVTLEAKKLTIYGEAPNELFNDALISFQAFIDEKLPEAISWFEDTGFSSGQGAGEPLGYQNAVAAVSVAKETGQSAATIVWENIVKAFSRMLPSSLGRAVWVCNIDTFPELATMALSVGTGGSAIWLQSGAGAAPMTILGRPVIFTEKAPTLGTVGDVNFVDFGYYLIGDRQAMQAATSPHYKFANDQTVFRVIERVDGRPWIASAVTPASGSANTLSPFVKIATRA